jgi:hypothetical protein
MQQTLPHGRGSDLTRSHQSRDRQGAILLEQVLHTNEQFIRTVSDDTYWRLYFLLTGGAK